MLSYNLRQVSRKDQGLVRCLSTPMQSLMLIARTFSGTSPGCFARPGVNWLKHLGSLGEAEGPSSDLLITFSYYRLIMPSLEY